MFMDEDKFPIPLAHNSFRTRIEIENYVNKLKEMYGVNYFIMKLYRIKTLLIYHLHLKTI